MNRTAAALGAASLLVVTAPACGDPEPELAPVPTVDATPLELSDDDLARLVADGPDRDWVCTNLPPELAEPVLAGTGEVVDVFEPRAGCLVLSVDEDSRTTVLDVSSSSGTEVVPDVVRDATADRQRIELPGDVDGWVVEVPAYLGSPAGVYARAVGRTSEGEPQAVGVHLAPGTQGRDLLADAEVLLRYYVVLNDVTGPLVGDPSS